MGDLKILNEIQKWHILIEYIVKLQFPTLQIVFFIHNIKHVKHECSIKSQYLFMIGAM